MLTVKRSARSDPPEVGRLGVATITDGIGTSFARFNQRATVRRAAQVDLSSGNWSGSGRGPPRVLFPVETEHHMAKASHSQKNGNAQAGLQMVGGAAAGAAAGSMMGPIGAAVGAVVGGIAGARAKDIAKSKTVKSLTSAAKKRVAGKPTAKSSAKPKAARKASARKKVSGRK